jgi:hypothetical protein
MWKLTFAKTRKEQKRIKSMEERLEAAVAESRRLRGEMAELRRQYELRDLRNQLISKRPTLAGTGTWSRDDDTVH